MNFVIHDVIKKIEEYKIPELNIKFINRFFEIEKFLNLLLNLKISWNFVIYGPWGCGKTEFFRLLTKVLDEFEDFVVTYVNLTEIELDRVIINVKPDVKNVIIQLVKDVNGDILKIIFHVYELIKRTFKKLNLVNKFVIFIIDEITKSLDRYRISIRDFVSGIDKLIHDITKEFKLRKMCLILITSDQTASIMFRREIGKSLDMYMMWHLSKNASNELLKELNCSLDYDQIWKLAGGCPRIVIDLWRNNWVVEHVLDIILRLCLDIYQVAKDLNELNYLKQIVEDIDNVIPILSQETYTPKQVLTKILFDKNIIISLLPESRWLSNFSKIHVVSYGPGLASG